MTAPLLKPPTVWRDNPQWKAETPAGVLDITINLAKPEKDPRAIAAAAHREAAAQSSSGSASTSPTACDLCWELVDADAARLVRSGDPARVVPLGGESWAWWYSPYGYFPEHLIVSASEHRPMSIEPATVDRLLDFVDAYPAYFIGSNADLPIVGGSLLSHDHFQGGRYRFPLMDAPLERIVTLKDAPGVHVAIVRWPSSVMRLRSTDREALSHAAASIIRTWRTYDDPACAIRAFTESTPHNTLNPIVWREGDDYVLDLVLRNNRTTAERPYGLFHPDESLFHIKKENIGLIEIMGRAILPARLAQELPDVKDEASQGFYQVLCATGVFKQNDAGRAGWDRFLAALGAVS
ncbi:galactose-1-phosphate uridylyltransferase [Adlercreutzia equolifaciens]|uniref:galactose-1-phosphate uridylyltransferase n=1 Tax=Adlercreutzia equolifaciens TaxID=446660 RepID=UPI0023B17C58|nr:galactose-1-phosphate uridylyltransferase [Adlercreutzia equolifaciens]MDE8702289.1 galactose-1-phosphate uridylyltransferase [Adlercreutzia equolifaciens]